MLRITLIQIEAIKVAISYLLVVTIEDLPVKGTNQVIKQCTVIRGISLGDDPRLVSGKANGGQSMYVIAEFCRKK